MKSILVLLLALVVACQAQTKAIAFVSSIPGDTNNWAGSITFTDNEDGTVNVQGSFTTAAENGLYGIHIHTYGDTMDPSFLGGHFAMPGSIHGCPPNATRHIGDLGNLNVAGGIGTYSYANLDLVALSGPNSIVGRAVVIHAVQDTCAPDWVGAKAAMGVIGIANTPNNAATIDEGATVYTAMAKMVPTGPAVFPAICDGGYASFYMTQAGKLRISMSISGLIPNQSLSFHIHQFGDMTPGASLGASAGGHYDPYNTGLHSWPTDPIRHAGDLGNFSACAYGNGWVNIDVDIATLNGPTSVVGRMLVVHNQTDIGPNAAKTFGNAGARIAWGIIGLSTPALDINAYAQEQGIVLVTNTPSSTTAGAMYSGWVTFTRSLTSNNVINVLGQIGGFVANSIHAIHVHQYGDISSDLSTGGHWNPLNQPHACPTNGTARHMGDMGNFQADMTGNIYINTSFSTMDLAGSASIVGRAVVVHQLADDCLTQPTGNAGGRLAAGVIGLANVPDNWQAGFGNPPIGGLGNGFYGLVLTAWITPLNGAPTAITGKVVFAYDWTNIQTNLTNMYAALMLSGFPPGSTHGMHIHSWGDATDRTGTNAAAHYNPYSMQHWLPSEAAKRHQGDLGNIVADANGNVNGLYGPFNVGMLTWDKNIIGRMLMIHADPDLGNAAGVTGGAGARVACGVIGVAAPIQGPIYTPPAAPPVAPPAMSTTSQGTFTSSRTSSEVVPLAPGSPPSSANHKGVIAAVVIILLVLGGAAGAAVYVARKRGLICTNRARFTDLQVAMQDDEEDLNQL